MLITIKTISNDMFQVIVDITARRCKMCKNYLDLTIQEEIVSVGQYKSKWFCKSCDKTTSADYENHS